MAVLPGRRYGEPAWRNTALHSEDDRALGHNGSYEEDRLGKQDPMHAAPMDSKISTLRERTPMSTFKSAVVHFDSPAYLIDKTAVVTVVVGLSPERCWVVHEQLLTSASRFVKTALTPGFRESEERTIRLPEEDPDVFDLFVNYLYTSTTGGLSLDMRLRLYVLADRLQAVVLGDSIRATLDGITCRFLSEAQLEYVLEHTRPGDLLRRSCILRLGEVIRAGPYFLLSDGFARLLCEKYAGEIFADMINKYDQIIMEPAEEDGSTVMSLLTPDVLAGPKVQDEPEAYRRLSGQDR
ncbi:hypothetical protein A1O7_03446 [Cladophialophora yegresii CBS 114405]|uniref:BTB domain-containing protein n=1 Tax=Cladophialophora yegresii CBS 114405 TaxID=1182544 RepID=W9W4J6_9EURO|nr:uncharacterized protein A1O7_03446 [Cladophialophora yegresii CBS 114405]EXJ63002.1 hypothetical protein A1O7_03446 [Cladophialophora yegresii CBS 114405]